MKYTRRQIEEAISIWKRMLGEAFNIRPDEIDRNDQLEKSVYDSCRRLPRDSYHGSILWNLYLKDKIRLPKNELEELYGKHGFQELEDNLKYYDNIVKDADFDKIRIGNLDFIIKDNQGLQQLRSAKGIRVVNNAIFNKINSEKNADSNFDEQYRLEPEDENNIKFLGQTQDFVVFSTKTLSSTNKFIYHVWRNSNMNTPYGNSKDDSACKINSPFCTRQKEHWSHYSRGDSKYTQFWIFLKPGNFKTGNLDQILSQLAFRGYDFLVGLLDTYNNNNDRFDGTCEFPDLRFFDKAGNDMTGKVEDQIINKLVFIHVDENLNIRISGSKDGPGRVMSKSELNAYVKKLAEDYLRGKSYNKNWYNYLTEFRIPDDVSVIPERAFADCRSLKSVVIPEGVTRIGYSAFSDCESLTSITIPEGVTEIGEKAFEGCCSLISVVIPEGVTEIGDGTFTDCRSLTSVVIPEGVTEIGDGAFFDCESLKSIVIPEGVTEIGCDAFCGCESLMSVVIPEGVTKICEGVFVCCTSLTSAVIPGSVTEIGWNVFAYCESLERVIVPNEEIKEMLVRSDCGVSEKIIEIKPKPLSESRHIEYLAHMLGRI